MNLFALSPRKTLNKAYLKVKPGRHDFEKFKSNLLTALEQINESESEEFHKNLIASFLKQTYYDPEHFINTKGRNDLVVHNGKNPQNTVGIIIETKKPNNKTEMVQVDELNKKAFQELLLYYMRERITYKNIELKHLVVCNVYEWFVFDAKLFERAFAQNKKLVEQFKAFEEKRLTDTTTDFFYREIAEPAIRNLEEIEFAYFDIRKFEPLLRDSNPDDDKDLIALYKFFSPEHLLKLPFSNDSNSLDKTFYNELLHIIGLEETNEGKRRYIKRKHIKIRDEGSLIENTITQLEILDKLAYMGIEKVRQYGKTNEERLFNIALELVITWVNRLLFLKLLEGQVIKYQNGNKAFSFLNLSKINDYDDLNKLFFQVLAQKNNDRNASIQAVFKNVPYLNSTLFEPSETEHKGIFISQLNNGLELRISSSTVLKDGKGKKKTGSIQLLEYLFDFLDAYDFSSEGAEDIQEESKTLINASVLGLLFEKLNGYKEGSFFTPGFVTMYMSRETIRRSIIQKFNSIKNWDCQSINQLYDKIEDKQEANQIINSLRICDPAVGSGHFLVSVLNEIIAAKSDLKILCDLTGKTLRDYHIEVENDELIITDDDGGIFEYHPHNKESQRIQETLFHEKQTIIENCLFGVDINSNSVNICRLRLWIELLKNAYYTPQSNFTELETLPNIDINIKCGNSLISRYLLDTDIKDVLKKNRRSVNDYIDAVMSYRNAKDKNDRRAMENLITEIKTDFKNEAESNDKRRKELIKLKGELERTTSQLDLLERTKVEENKREIKIKKLKDTITKKESELEQIKSGLVYENSFEWRFEFPEVLDNDGTFIGFDMVIGNPPYLNIEDIEWGHRRFFENIYNSATGRFDLYLLFIEKAMQLKVSEGTFSFIVPGKFLNNKQLSTTRKMICNNHDVNVVKIDDKVFEEAQVDSAIIESYPPFKETQQYQTFSFIDREPKKISQVNLALITQDKDVIFRIEINNAIDKIISKIEKDAFPIDEIADVKDGIVAGAIKDVLFLKEKLDSNSKRLYFGKHLSRYHLSETDIWVNYKPNEMMKIEIERKDGKRPGLWLRDERIFNREKILSRFVAKEIIATYDNENKYYEHTLHSTFITDKRFRAKYVLGLYNSSLLNFFYKKKNSHGGDIFPQVRISSIEKLPIKLADEPMQTKIEDLVNTILETKNANPDANTTILEEAIDKLVYTIYQLDDNETQIIEIEKEANRRKNVKLT